MILVKVAILGSRTNEVSINDNSTVADALKADGRDTAELDIRIDGQEVDKNHKLSEGDIISLTPRVKGGRS